MSLTLAQIARLVDGQLLGDGQLPISGAATLSTARPGEITFCDNAKLATQLARCQAAAAIVPHGLDAPVPHVVVADVHAAFAKVVAQANRGDDDAALGEFGRYARKLVGDVLVGQTVEAVTAHAFVIKSFG